MNPNEREPNQTCPDCDAPMELAEPRCGGKKIGPNEFDDPSTSVSITPAELAEWRAAIEARSSGEWIENGTLVLATHEEADASTVSCEDWVTFKTHHNDADRKFWIIANAALPRLIDEVEKQAEQSKRLIHDRELLIEAAEIDGREIESLRDEVEAGRREIESLKRVVLANQQAASDLAASDLAAQLREAQRERDLAIAHDRQPYPTAEAYEKACEALNEKTDALREAQGEVEQQHSERKRMTASWLKNQCKSQPFPCGTCVYCSASEALATTTETTKEPR